MEVGPLLTLLMAGGDYGGPLIAETFLDSYCGVSGAVILLDISGWGALGDI